MTASFRYQQQLSRQTLNQTLAPLISGVSVTVPVQWFGAHFSLAPTPPVNTTGVNAGLTPAVPSFAVLPSIAWTRSHDSAPTWRDIHTAPGTYSAAKLAVLDAWVNYHFSLGRKIIYTVFSTPTFIAATSPNFSDQFGNLYAANAPSDLGSTGSATLFNFVTMLMNRYNSGGNHKIAAVEVWNEPHYDSSASTYFTGTAVQMAQIAKTVYSAVKAVDSTVLVLSPGFVGNPAIFITPYLNAAIGDGTYGRAYQDGLAYHWYDFGSVSSNIAYYDFVNTSGAIQASLIAGGLTSAFPIYLTENGWLTSWTTLDSISRAKRICQLGAVVAALGYKSIVMYLVDGGYYDSAGNVSAIYGTTNLIGAPLTDTNVIKAYAWVASLSGQVITEMGYSDTGKVYLNTSVGTVISPY